MRNLIWHIRSLFCKHDWKYEESSWTGYNIFGQKSSGYIVSATCEKCGWHRSYEKF